MARGASLESAISAACVHYERANKARIKKNPVDKIFRGGRTIFRSKAPIDFHGTIQGGRSIALEAKECHTVSFALSYDHLSLPQRMALDKEVALGGDAFLIIDMTIERIVFRCDWRAVQTFIQRPWRKSLDIKWLQANADVCKESDRDNPKKRAVWVLDVAPHPHKEMAFLAVAAERASKPVIDLDALPEKPVTPTVRRTAEECKAAVRNAIAAYRPKSKQGWRGGK